MKPDQAESSTPERTGSASAAASGDRLHEFPGLAGKLKRLLEEAAGAPREPRVLGDYRLLRRLGSGGMATVYEAEQTSLGRRVALKVLSAHLSLSERAVQKFQREAEAASRQTHPGIVTVYSIGEESGVHYIAAELVEGGRTLADELQERRREVDLPRGWFRGVAERIAGVAEALEHVHVSGVIHRDVKPSNILLTTDGRPRITDFGLARVEDALALSRTGDFLGTPYYMSPEQVTGRRDAIDARTDVFSLGVTLYECLTLERPFEGETPQEVLGKIVLREPRDPLGTSSRVPRDLGVICLKAMEKDPRHRYQSMRELAADLRRFVSGEAIAARPASLFRRVLKVLRRRRVLVLSLVASFVVASVVSGLVWELQAKQREERRVALEDYRYWREALEWPSDSSYASPASVIRDVDPSSPCIGMLRALFALDEGRWAAAREHLEACIASSERGRPGRIAMTSEANYLLAITLCSAAEETADEREAQTLRRRAEACLRSSGDFDLTAPGALVLREPGASALPAAGLAALRRDLELRAGHPFCRQYRAVRQFEHLYKGGEIGQFTGAIEDFEGVLEQHPDNATANGCLGRTYYFFARTYEFLDFLELARERVLASNREAGAESSFLNYITLGQIDLLLGECERAQGAFEEALDAFGSEGSLNRHNSYRGIAQVHSRAGRHAEALEWFALAAEVQGKDPHLCVALAEYYLLRGEPQRGLEAVLLIENVRLGSTGESPSRHSSVHLAIARCRLALGDQEAALDSLRRVYLVSREYPRTWSLACLLLATCEPRDAEEARELASLADSLSRRASHNSTFEDRSSPICLSGRGASAYLRGEYERASSLFDEALRARDGWPERARAFHWAEDARDRYFIALCEARRALALDAGEPDLAAARRAFALAEEAWMSGARNPEDADFVARVRSRAQGLLGP